MDSTYTSTYSSAKKVHKAYFYTLDLGQDAN